jgi:integrase
VTFHVLRHTFASILIAQGHDPVFVSRQLGHANAAITLRVYAHLFDAERHAAKARKRLEADYGRILSGSAA